MNCSNDNYGFYLDGENQVIINCSVCMDNSQSGIYYCDGNGFSSIYENNFTNNGNSGIDIDGSALNVDDNTINNNNCSDNANGILLAYSNGKHH